MVKKYKRFTKKQLKKDKFREKLIYLFYLFQKEKRKTSFVLIFLIVVISGLLYFQAQRKSSLLQAAYEFREALQLFMFNNFTEALSRMEDIQKLYPKTPQGKDALYWLGQIYYYQGNYTKARSYFEECLETHKNPTLKQASLLAIGDIYLQQNNPHKAVKTYQELMKKYPNSFLIPKTLHQISLAYELLNQPNKAHQTREKLKSLYPNSAYAK